MGNGKSAKLDLARRDFLLRNRRGGIQTNYRSFGELRHKKQVERIKEVDGIEEDERILLFAKFERGIYLSGGNRHPSRCCLFNVIVAFEWNPGYYEAELLRTTCDEAANLLFDVTDGYMSFNRIIVGGPELMKCADIQIFASNRLFPRAWVNGLHIEEKYQPIRIGRGYWRKDARRADPWHKNLGAAVLVHEWLHYAVGMKDDYVKLDNEYALPKASAAVNTLMANLESSELKGTRLGLKNDKDEKNEKDEWELLRTNQNFSWLQIPDNRSPQNIPPDESPAPRFNLVGTAKQDSKDDPQVWLNLERADLDDKMALDHCWVFVGIDKEVKDPEEQKKLLTIPDRLIAQGSYEKLPEGYRIIGVQEGAFIILIGHTPKKYEPKVLYRQVGSVRGSTIQFLEGDWEDATPTNCQLPLVAVSINREETSPPYQVSVKVVNKDDRRWTPTLFPLGEQEKSDNDNVEALDGHVLLVSSNPGKDDRLELAIANFSIGGSPGAAYPGSPNPVPAGSSDGNAMIFFYDKEAMKLRENVAGEQIVLDDVTGEQTVMDGKTGEKIVLDASSLRIITTTNLHSPSSNIGCGPRSYTFTLMPNEPLPIGEDGVPKLNPTLVLYFDKDTKEGHLDATLKIHRLEGGKWIEIAKNYQQEDPDNKLVAAKLNKETAPGLFENLPTSECYRLFLVEERPNI